MLLWIIVGVLVLGLIGFLYYFQYESEVPIFEKIKNSWFNEEVGDEEDSVEDLNDEVGERVGGSGSGERGEEGFELPDDLESVPCGFYFADYNICAGVCPGGVCELEGRSCYCKSG